jgi:S-formylglutathione hydrolase FrmB
VHCNTCPPGAPQPPKALPVEVMLPDGSDPRRRYPVLYLRHGHGDCSWSWASDAGQVRRIAAGFPGIVVMPEGGTGWYTNWWEGGARSPAWESYHLDELIPLVERRLPIARGRAMHAIVGLSMGGEGAMYYAEQRPGYFGAVGSFSGVLDLLRPEWPTGFDTQGEKHADVYGDPSAQRFYWEGHDPTTLAVNLRHTRIYVAVGDGVDPMHENPTNYFGAVAEAELHQQADDFAAAARSLGDDLTYAPRGGIHDWPYWRQDFANFLRWGPFGHGVSNHVADWTFKTVAQHGVAWDMRFDFASPPDAVETFVRAGEYVRPTGAGVVTLRFDHRRPVTWALPFSRRLPPLVSSRRRCRRGGAEASARRGSPSRTSRSRCRASRRR